MEALEIIKLLEKKGFTRDEAIKFNEHYRGKDSLATKEDLYKVEKSLGNRLSKVEVSMKWIQWAMGLSISISILILIKLFLR